MRSIIFTLVSLLWLTACNNFLPPQPVKSGAGDLTADAQNVKLEATFESIKANIIDTKCLSCHKPGGKGQDVPLETQEQILNGTVDEKPLVQPGKAIESVLYLVLLSDTALRGELEKMPPPKAIEQKKAKEITKEEIDIIAAWINGIAKKDSTLSKDESPTKGSDSSPKAPAEKADGVKNPPLESKVISDPQPPVVLNFDYIKSQILDKKCSKCHKPGGKAESMDFTSRKEILLATTDVGESIIVVNKPESSLLYLSLLPNQADRQGAKKMPSAKAVKAGDVADITPEETKIIEEWIKQGAP